MALRWAATLLLLAAAPAPAPAQESGPEAPLLDPAAGPAELRKRLAEAAPAIAGFADARTAFNLATWSSGDENDRRILDEATREFLTRCREAAVKLGFAPAAELPLRTVVRVTVAGAHPCVVETEDGTAVLVRDALPEIPATKPVMPERYDGPPMLRDLLEGARTGRRWLRQERARARSSGPGSLRFALARSVVRACALPDGCPAWVPEALASCIETAARTDGSPDPHVPGAIGSSVASWKAILAGGAPPPGSVPVLGRGFATLLQGKTDVPARLAKLAAGGAPASPEVFGAEPVEAIRAVAAKFTPSGDAACRADGTIPCGLCRGTARHSMACTECEGSGAIPCPSCGASDICAAPFCDGGLFPISETHGVDCGLCNGYLFIYCLACKDPALKCGACRGQGKMSWACPLCEKGRLPCPECPRSETAPCGSCAGKAEIPCAVSCLEGKTPWSCRGCGGAGYRGCTACFGYHRVSDGRNGDYTCTLCSDGKHPCGSCDGKGQGKISADRCPMHPGARAVRPCPACALPEVDAPPAAPEAVKPEVLQAAIEFIMKSKDSTGAFASRRLGTLEGAGTLRKHSLFSNAVSLWTLFTAGRSREEPEMKAAWSVLCLEAERVADGTATDTGTQEAAFALRALLVGGQSGKHPIVQKLVARLVRSQRPDGLWADEVKTREVRGDVLNALIVLEALRVARDRGVSVPSETWSRASTAAAKLFSSRKVKAKKGDILTATDVACCVSLIVIAKAGTLGDKAATFDYRQISEVRAGLAWLDRHFDPKGKATYLNGARVHRRDLEGYFAYMYSMQRLAMLLGISDFNGHRWFAEGGLHLQSIQRKDGSFEEIGYGGLNSSVVSTTFAVLFLVRATTPISSAEPSR